MPKPLLRVRIVTASCSLVAAAAMMHCTKPPGSDEPPVLSCSTDCPQGTRIANREEARTAGAGAFVVVEAQCESVCIPETICLPPTVPTVSKTATGSVFTCQALPGFTRFPADSEVSFQHASGWPPLCQPLLGRLGTFSYQGLDGAILGELDGRPGADLVSSIKVQLPGGSNDWKLGGFLNDGGTFADPQERDGYFLPWLVGDFDGDGKGDLFAGRSTDVNAPGDIVVMRGGGDGSFGEPQVIGSFCDEEYVRPELRDLDGDGNLDIVSVMADCAGTPQPRVYIWAGRGDGTFDERFDTGIAAERLLLGDFDENGELDLLVQNGGGERRGTWQLAIHEARWTYELLPLTGRGAGPINGVGDFDGDGHLDLWVQEGDTSETLTIYFGDGAGGFTAGTSSRNWERCRQRLVADLDGDSKDEAICSWQDDSSSDFVTIIRFKSDGAVLSELERKVGGRLAVADFDGDGQVDLISFSGIAVNGWKERL